MDNLFISVATFNRKNVVEICLANLKKYKRDSYLKIYDDCSSEYGVEFLSQFGPVYRAKKNLGIDPMKEFQFRDFLETDYDYLYITDSDAIHDPNFIDVLRNAPKDKPLSLYTSQNAGEVPKKWINEDIPFLKTFHRKYSGGISHLYSRKMAQEIVKCLDFERFNAWDYHTIDMLGTTMNVTLKSYVDHLGAHGVHSGGSWYSDYALDSTTYLRELRSDSIMYIEGLGLKPEI